MASESSGHPTSFTLRWLGPLILLLVEYLGISLTFDALPLLEGSGLASSFGHLGIAAPLALVVATVAHVLGGRRLRGELVRATTAAPLAPWLALNVASYAGLFALTGALLSRSASGAEIPLGWLVGWVALALASALSLLFIALPPRAAWDLARRSRTILLTSLGVGALAWLAGIASGRLWDVLRTLTLDSVFLLLVPFTDEIGYAPEDAIIGVGDFFVVVAPECSGLEGIGLIVVVLGVYLWSAREQLRFPRALLLVPIGVALVWLGNSLRIALLIAVGVHISPETALSGFHSKAGWLFFCAIGVSLIAYAQRSAWFAREPAAVGDSAVAGVGASTGKADNPTAAYLTPQLALLATSLVTGLFVISFDRFYGLRILAALLALWIYRARLPAPRWPASWHAPLIGVAVFGLWLWLAPRPGAEQLAEHRAELAQLTPLTAAVWLAIRALGSTLVVPIAEELAFRAYLLRRLVDADFRQVPLTRQPALALVASSVAFGLLHGQAWLAATLAGLAYALAQRARGRTADAVVAHAVTNGLIAAAALLFGADWLWG